MRFAVGVLLCLNAGAVSLALADPPATPQTTSTAAPAAAASADAAATPAASAPAAAAETPAKATVEAFEKQLLSQGYKPEMRHGVKFYCRREPMLGSRLNEAKHCGTIEELKVSVQETREAVEKIQRSQKNPQGG